MFIRVTHADNGQEYINVERIVRFSEQKFVFQPETAEITDDRPDEDTHLDDGEILITGTKIELPNSEEIIVLEPINTVVASIQKLIPGCKID